MFLTRKILYPLLRLWVAILSILLLSTPGAANPLTDCLRSFSLLSKPPTPVSLEQSSVAKNIKIPLEKLSAEIAARRARVPEFQFIREEAEKRGLRVWLFGGTAAGYAHYTKEDLLRELGDTRFQPNRFDYDYTNIYRSTQDLDIVVDGSAKQAEEFERMLKEQFPYFLGSKAAGWEVRSIKEARNDKGGLLGDFGFMNQHTDSNSTGMVELTNPPASEGVVRDIRDWDNLQGAQFLKDVHEGVLSFYHSSTHFQTPRAQSGQNPPIFAVVRALTKAFQYNLKIKPEHMAILQKEIQNFNAKKDLANPEAARWMEKNGKKLFQHAVDIEYAWDTLEKLGLRRQLIAIKNDPQTENSLSWWLSREPLRTKPVGEKMGRTAASLGLATVAHETRDFLAYESITRSHTGAPNVFESRNGVTAEAAVHGQGFYTAVGKKGARGTGITIRFTVKPEAREGTDFIFVQGEKSSLAADGEYIVWLNKDAIRVIPESLDFTPVGYFQFLAEGKSISADDQALLWKLKRKLDHTIISGRIPEQDLEEIRAITLAQIKSNAPNKDIVIQEWLRLEGARLKKDPKTIEQLAKSWRTKTYQVDPAFFFTYVKEIVQHTSLEHFITREWLPSLLQSLKTDLGDRALEHCLFSRDSAVQAFGQKALGLREAASAFVRALKNILAQGQGVKAWLQSEAKSAEKIEEKAAYLAIHPKLRSTLNTADRPAVLQYLGKISNLSVFEELAKGQLPVTAKAESFQFQSFTFPKEGKRVKLGTPKGKWGRQSDEDPYEVTFKKSFAMQATPVTQLQWSLVMGENPSSFKEGGEKIQMHGGEVYLNPNRPIEGVSWDEVQEFIEKLNLLDPLYNYRLPTEAEWEFATRAGSDEPYFFGNDPGELGTYAWHTGNSDHRTHDVADLKPNRNGLYDLYGNVWEWLQDRYQKNHPEHAVDPPGPDLGSSRVFRGCAWNCDPKSFPHLFRSANRSGDLPYRSAEDHGFRLARTPK